MFPPSFPLLSAALVPCTVIIILLVTLNTLVVTYVHTTIPDLVGIVLSPLVMFIDSPLAILLFGFLVSLFWWFGIHDTFITSPLGILWNPIGLANQAAHVAGTALPHIVTSAFWWTFMAIGGSGATFSLCLLLLAAKSKHLKMVGKLGIIPSLFNINEPIIFGLPIMLNPLMVIPFILALPINGLITYAAMATGLVAKTFTTASWNLFAPFAAFISTMDWKAAALTIILILIDIVLYFPFVKVMDNQKLKEEQMLAEQAAVK